MAPVPAPQKSGKPKALAFVALIGLDDKAASMLRDCFKQFGIETAAFNPEEAPVRFKKEKYEAVVLRLRDNVEGLLKSIRSSANTQRMVIYGICSTAQEALHFSQYGVNAIFNDPLDRQNLLRVIRATHLLVLHELRRYVRIPIVADVALRSDGGDRFRATLIEISGGGMSMQMVGQLTMGEFVDVSFRLPNSKELSLRGTVAWIRRDAGTVGVRFEAMDPGRSEVKSWIDDYLDID